MTWRAGSWLDAMAVSRLDSAAVPADRARVGGSLAFRIGRVARETAMNRSRLFLSGAVLIGLLLLVAAWPTARPAAQPGGAMQIDGDDIGGVVTGKVGGEAGRWVIVGPPQLGYPFREVGVPGLPGR